MIKLPEPAVHGLHAYTESQMRQAIKDAYEEAAKVCEAADDWHPQEAIAAAAIRKLSEELK